MNSIIHNASDLDNYPLLLTIEDLVPILGIGKTTAYNLVKSGQIKSVRIGRTFKIPKQFVLNFIGLN